MVHIYIYIVCDIDGNNAATNPIFGMENYIEKRLNGYQDAKNNVKYEALTI